MGVALPVDPVVVTVLPEEPVIVIVPPVEDVVVVAIADTPLAVRSPSTNWLDLGVPRPVTRS